MAAGNVTGPSPASLGPFDHEARRAAVESSLPLLATYFASADTWDLVAQPAVSDLQGQLDAELAGAVRLRVLLALGEELLPILQTIMAQPTFRYAQRSDESVGLLAGRLDVPRYVLRRGRRTAPKVYPVRVVERDHATPENLLAVSALQAISRALSAVPTDRLPPGEGPERRQLARVRGDLRRYERMPLATSLSDKARVTARRRPLAQQRLEVLRRIERGDLRQAAAYRRMTDWVLTFLTGAGLKPESRLWAFYDERFDPRLFEIWTLGALGRCLTKHYGVPDGGALEPLWARSDLPIGTWTTPYGRVEVFFQREMAGLDRPGRWTIPSRGHRLRALPDVVLRLTVPGEEPRWLLIDCKLRRRAPLPTESDASANSGHDEIEPETQPGMDLPTEEVYKLLGYFEHLLSEADPSGALVYYTPGGNGTLSLEAPEPRRGRAALIGVDPAEPQTAESAICRVVDEVARLLNQPDGATAEAAQEAAQKARAAGGDAVEAKAAFKQQVLVEVLRSYGKQHEEQLPAVQKLTRAWFNPDVWDDLDDDTRRMVLSAELYGSQQLEDLDHSGPLLVMCAACERELNLRVFTRVVAMFSHDTRPDGSHVIDTHATLGGAIETLHRAERLATAWGQGEHDAEERVLANISDPSFARAAFVTGRYLEAVGVDLDKIKALVRRLRSLNVKYRRPSAHDEVVEATVWSEGRTRILGQDGILSNVVEALR